MNYCRNHLDEQIVDLALGVLERRLRRLRPTTPFETPEAAATYLQLKLADREREIVAVLLLNNKHRLIEYRELFHGTVDGSSLYPREVVKAALAANAAGVILAHNHPSGDPEPSQADKDATDRLKRALALIDVRLLDHLVIGHECWISMSRNGYL